MVPPHHEESKFVTLGYWLTMLFAYMAAVTVARKLCWFGVYCPYGLTYQLQPCTAPGRILFCLVVLFRGSSEFIPMSLICIYFQ